MPSSLESVILRINGSEHADWTSYSIDSDLLTPADAWEVSLGIPTAKTPKHLRLWSPVLIQIEGTQVLAGRIDQASHYTSKGERRLSLSGRDNAGILLDCSAPIFTARKVGLEDVIGSIIKPLGISAIEIQVTGKHEKISITPGMTAWQALAEVCEANECHAWFNPDGKLIIGGPDYSAKVAGELILDPDSNTSNVINLEVIRQIKDIFSEITVLGQSHGTEDFDGGHNIKATLKNDTLIKYGVYRPYILQDGDIEGQDKAKKRALTLMEDGTFNGLTIKATVRGHRITKDGDLWEPGQRIRVRSVPDKIDNTYFLTARTFIGSRAGQSTALTLRPDNIWLSQVAKKGKMSGAGKEDDVVNIISKGV